MGRCVKYHYTRSMAISLCRNEGEEAIKVDSDARIHSELGRDRVRNKT